MNEEAMQECIKNCKTCVEVCRQAADQMRQAGADEEHIRTLEDCADMCELHVRFMERGSNYHVDVAKLCAQICGDCAEQCESMGDEDELMARCAEACRACEATCQAMTSAA